MYKSDVNRGSKKKPITTYHLTFIVKLLWKYCKIRTKIIIFNLISVGFKQYFLDYIQIFILGVETKKKLIN